MLEKNTEIGIVIHRFQAESKIDEKRNSIFTRLSILKDLWPNKYLIYFYFERLLRSRKARIITSTILAFLLLLLNYHNCHYRAVEIIRNP